MSEVHDINMRILILSVAYSEKLLAASTARDPMIALLSKSAELQLNANDGCLDSQYTEFHTAALKLNIDLICLLGDHSKVICTILMRILSTGEYDIHGR